ncbi:MAG: GntR family transcriptional regulator [Geminicoccaceae bacterium]
MTGAPDQPQTVYSIREEQSLGSLLPDLETFTPVVPPSRSATVADRIVEAVAAGRLASGQRLVEQDVAASLAVSRVPLREAMKTLCAQGILTAEPHRGTRVAPIDEAWSASVRRARIALERLAFRDAVPVLRAEPARTHELRRLIAEMERHTAQQNWLQGIKTDLAFHRSVVVAGGDGIVVTLWEALARHVLIVFGRETRPEWSGVHLGEEHRELLTALLESSPDELDREVERHIMRMPSTEAAPS